MPFLTNDNLVRLLVKLGLANADGFLNSARPVVSKTASYTILPTDQGTDWNNAGASGAVTFTLPAPSPALLGVRHRFMGVADQNIIVATATADTLITKHDAAADSIALQTSSEKIGGVIEAICINNGGTYQWLAFGASVGHTFTVVTA